VAILDKVKNLTQKRKKAMAYRLLFSKENVHARIVLKDMCEAHGVFDGGFDPDPYVHAHNAGERRPVLRILTLLNMSLQDILDLAEGEDE